MAARTVKQREQWEYRSALGDVTGLPRWIGSKMQVILKRSEIDAVTKQELSVAAAKLIERLREAEHQIRSAHNASK